MSLFSTFYVGDANTIEGSIRSDSFPLLDGTGISKVDFSGGIQSPFLFPEDFRSLVSDGKKSFWDLEGDNLLESDESGLYRLPRSEIEKIVALSQHNLMEFSKNWSSKRKQELEPKSTNAIRRNKPYWTVFLGITLGIAFGAITSNMSALILLMLLAWIITGLSLGIHLDNKIKARTKLHNETMVAVNWIPRINELQELLKYSMKSDVSVFYYWSL